MARGEARPGDGVELLVEFSAGLPLSLVGLASLRAELTEALGARADLVECTALPRDVQAAAERDAVRVL